MRRFYQSISLTFLIVISAVTFGAAMDDTSTEAERPSVIIENNVLYRNCLVGIRIQGTTPVALRGC
ncbi:MAG: hypothetical protein JRI70_01065, partial [Deltaproteobacteria bacterium]|nr:hypothetical protein [Deltaproteobacteria bacterium]